ncbi:formimidoylglutamate deiminase [soil metagenome]
MTVYWCEYAWLDDAPVTGVRVTVDGGRITEVQPGTEPVDGDHRLPGLVLPGFANAHSHAFHRALRGRTHNHGGTFWTWREAMYAIADRLHPDSYLALARAAYAEMALAGVTCVGEFHYLHHGPGGRPYDDPNAMSAALVQAAGDAGVRLTLLDACYLSGGLAADGHQPLDPVQLRFADADADSWADRAQALPLRTGVRLGAAVHSVRAVPADHLAAVAEVAGDGPLHVHLSEQPAENVACQSFYGLSPTALLADRGVLGRGTTAVHATHLSDHDIDLLSGSATAICACPSTEADLADGIGPFRALADAGSPLCVGTDQHAHTDPLGEARAVESYERLTSGVRGRFAPAELVDMLTAQGHRSLGWGDAGQIAAGQRADLVSVRLDSPRTAGSEPAQAVLAASAADVHTVIVDGRVVVADSQHLLGNVGQMLVEAIEPLWGRR